MFGKKPPGENPFGNQPNPSQPENQPTQQSPEPSQQAQHPPAQDSDPAQQSPQQPQQSQQNTGGEQLPAVAPQHQQQQQNAVQATPQGGQQSGLVEASQQSGLKQPSGKIENKVLKYLDSNLNTPDFQKAKKELVAQLVDKINFNTLQTLPEENRKQKVREAAHEILSSISAALNAHQLRLLEEQAIDEILGFGPIEPLLQDNDISDIMINTAKRIYIEKQGKLYLTDITFLDERHLLGVIQRIVSRVGRRVDEANPMVDARMPDGSRFNAIIPPLSLDGSLVSIRKFKRNKMPLSAYVEYQSMSEQMYRFLELCSNVRLNVIVSGGTGSGKTTLLNALSGHIDEGERVITIEDAAELQLHQPHVLRLETRPPSLEGRGEITQRQLVKNALRMRPDRIILGEIRGDEVIDVLSAMNTGHDGSMATIHSNNPRDCLSRIENLVGMSSVNLPIASLRYQIASALQVIVQLERMRDGRRRITHIEEIVGLESGVISTQTLFGYRATGLDENGELQGEFICHGIRPKMLERAKYFGKEKDVLECLNMSM
ncbi:MAG: hypothetical protein CMM94_04800 [Rickettsiales bacterium]|nr:hypothetical protein [Rickettsiales bacterium]